MLHRRFPKLFTSNNNSKSMESKSNPSTPQSKPKPRPRLDRTNAAKNIDYEPQPPPSTSTSNFSSSSSIDDDNSIAMRTRSIDVYPWGDRTSFRIDGKQEGEFDFICKSLGFSSPDDFGISVHEYDAMKHHFSPQLHTSVSDNVISLIDPSSGDSNIANNINASVDSKVDKFIVPNETTQVEEVKAVVRSSWVGIKGERPPAVLLTPPPPMMTMPVCDDVCSGLDVLLSFGPESDRVSTIEDEHEESTSQAGGDEEVMRRGRTMRKESGVLSGSCSFTSNSNDDDCSSTTTDPMSISPSGRLTRQISSWAKGRHLGSGSYGSVYEGIADGGFFFAVKEVSLLDQGNKGKEIIYQFEQEMAFLSQFDHKNIVRYLGTDKDDSNLYIFLELVSQGSLLSLYQRFHLQDSHVSVYTRQILEGLKYLHERNVVHRDIKCANILSDVDGYVKLADFGLAKVAKLNDAKSCKGTPFWMAPEVVKPNQGYGRAADIWSLGCTVLEMLTRNFPYHPFDGFQAMFQIGLGHPPPVPDSLSRDARDFILKCLQVDPDTRPSAADLLEHPFVKRPHLSSASASPHHHGLRT